jgi:shikimate kinase
MNVVLVGIRGSGKTSLGMVLAERLKRDFVDCDELIERKTLLSVTEIIAKCGEAYFRLIESGAIEELSRTNGKVVSTGGGAVLHYRNVVNLKRNGVVFFLDVDPETAWERICADPTSASRRPPLTDKEGLEELREQATQRRAYYLKAADYIVSTQDRVIDQVLNRIMELLKDRPDLDPEP